MNTEPSQAELALAMNLSKSRITALKKKGMPVNSLAAAEAWRLANQSIARRKAGHAPGAARSDLLAVPQPDTSQRSAFDAARTRREVAEARLAELRQDEAEGTVIQVAAVERVWAQGLAAMREHLLQLRARVAPMLAAETDPLKIELLLEEEIVQALQHVAGADLMPSGPPGA